MILFDMPAAEATRPALDLICDEMGFSNLIALTSSGPASSPKTQGTLSIKCAFNGSEVYEVDGRALRVGESSYLILNEGQRYTSYIEMEDEVDSLCLFFRPGFVEETWRGLTVADDSLLDDPAVHTGEPLLFIEKLYRDDEHLSPLLFQTYSTLQTGRPTAGWIEERFYELATTMLEVHRGVLTEIGRLPSIRRSTRIEIYRRLSRARDYIGSSYTEPIGLQKMAEEARLSPHHFLRLFKQAFGITPHQHITRLRLEHAERLLVATEQPVSAICFDLGFESPGSFSLLFRRHYGISPKGYRLRYRAGK